MSRGGIPAIWSLACRWAASRALAGASWTGGCGRRRSSALPFGDGRTYNVGASTLSLRERGCPAGFTVIEADEASIQVTAQGWTGRGFEPQRSWGFDRRRQGGPEGAPPPAPEAADGREGRPPAQVG